MKINKSLAILFALAGASGACANTIHESASENPLATCPFPKHVIVILADDLGYGDISCYGNTVFQTPNIDQLLQNGIKFNRVYSSSATCTPSRYTFFTGEYPFRKKGTGILPGDANMIITPGRTTLATVFQQNGYTTAAIGKWHLGLGTGGKINWNKPINAGPNQIGFDYSFIQAATNDRVPCVFVENNRVVGLDPNDPIEVSYGKKIGNDPTGKENPELLKLKHSHGHNNTIVNGIGRIGFMTGGHAARWVDEYMADSFTTHVTQFIDKNKDKPFFIYYGSPDPHVPRTPNPRFVGKSGLGARGDVILQLDDNVGTIVKKLKDAGIYDETMIIFTSDNGPVLDDGYADQAIPLNKAKGHTPWGKTIRGNQMGGKYGILEAGTRIPFIVSYPQMDRKNMTSDALMSQCDVMGSFVAQFKMTPPSTMVDAQNQWNALTGRDLAGRKSLIADATDGKALVTADWKFTRMHNKKEQLYNLKEDSKEKTNVIKENPEKANAMRIEFESLIAPPPKNVQK